MESAKLTDLFDESSIVSALKMDPWIKKIESEFRIDLSASLFSDFIANLNKIDGQTIWSEQSFVVMQYHGKKNLVSVRVVAEEHIGYGHHKHFQLGLWLKPREDTRHLFSRSENFFLGAFPNGLDRLNRDKFKKNKN